MKPAIILFFITAGVQNLSAQVNIGGNIEKGYRDFVLQTRSVITKNELNDFNALGGEKRFFSSKWEKGKVTSNGGASVSTSYTFNYDFLDKQLYTLYKDTVIAVDENYINSFYLEKSGTTHFFVKIPSIDNTGFMESVGYDSTKARPVLFLKNRTPIMSKGDKNSYLSNFSGEYSDNIKDKSEYYLYFPDGTSAKVRIDKKVLSEALEKYSEKTAPFFKSVKKITEDNIKDLLMLVNS